MERKPSKQHTELLYTLLILLAGLCVYLFAGEGKCAFSGNVAEASASAVVTEATPRPEAAATRLSGVPEAIFRTALESGGFLEESRSEASYSYEGGFLLRYETQGDAVICATLLIPPVAAAPESTDTLIEQALKSARLDALQSQAALLQDALFIVIPAIDPEQSVTRADLYAWHALALKARDEKESVEDTQGRLTFSAFWDAQAGGDILVVSVDVRR